MKKNNFKKTPTRYYWFFGTILLLVVFLFVKPAAAGFMANIIGGVIEVLIRGVSAILILLVNVFMSIATYSNFIKAPAVVHGWVLVRNLCNMLFVVVLLFIAFATILGQEKYNAKNTLPKLVLAAVLINFSKMICGLTIDLANVVMLTFVNSFSTIGAGNILNILGIEKITKLQENKEIKLATLVTSYIFGLLYVIIATVVIGSMVAMLVIRTVMIWILTVLSPLAFFLQTIPGKGAQYASKWWDEWTKNLLVGPVLAFFLWLSFAALQVGTNPIAPTTQGDEELRRNLSNLEELDSGIATEAGGVESMVQFVIAIGMLIGGMTIAQSIGGLAGGAIGGGMKALNKGKAKVVGAAKSLGVAGAAAVGVGAAAVGRGAGRLALTGITKFGPKDATGQPTGVAKFADSWNRDLRTAREEKKVTARKKVLEKFGFSEGTARAGKEFFDSAQDTKFFSTVNRVTGYRVASPVPKKEYADRAKRDIRNYEANLGAGGKNSDEALIRDFKWRHKSNPNLVMNNQEEDALARSNKYREDKDIVEKYKYRKSFGPTVNAFESLYKEKDDAKKEKDRLRVNRMARSKTPLKEDYYYSSNGLDANNKAVLDAMNSDAPGEAGAELRDKALEEITSGRGTTDQLQNLASALQAFTRTGERMERLQDIANALGARGVDYTTAASQINFKDYDSSLMRHRPEQGGMAYDSFGKNSLKPVDQRKNEKDIMELSFGRLDQYNQENGTGVNPLGSHPGAFLDGESLKNFGPALGGLINAEIDQIKNQAGSSPSPEQSAKIGQLEAIKTRLGDGSLNKLELKNSDIEYLGDTDSKKRAHSYNVVQHEKIHSAGFKDEELTHKAADALQENKLIGNIPNTNKRYDEELGKMMASLSAMGANTKQIEEEMLKKINDWSLPNVDRVLESESGVRSNLVEETNISVNVDGLADKIVAGLGQAQGSLSGNIDNLADKIVAGFDKSQKLETINYTLRRMAAEQQKNPNTNL